MSTIYQQASAIINYARDHRWSVCTCDMQDNTAASHHRPGCRYRHFVEASVTLEQTEQSEGPLKCDFCGAATDDPWHTSSATEKHLHQCDACHTPQPAQKIVAWQNPFNGAILHEESKDMCDNRRKTWTPLVAAQPAKGGE